MAIENHVISPYEITLNDIGISSEQIAEIDSLAKTPGGGLIVICGDTSKGKTTTFRAVTNHILATRKLGSGSAFILSDEFDSRQGPVAMDVISAVMGGAQYIGVDGYVRDPSSLLATISTADAPDVLTVMTYHADETNLKSRLAKALLNDPELVKRIDNNLIGIISQDLIREDAHMVKPKITVTRLRSRGIE